jgi:hypothetical protein
MKLIEAWHERELGLWEVLRPNCVMLGPREPRVNEISLIIAAQLKNQVHEK